MTVIKINAITVREGSGDELARRFAKRSGAVDGADGFEGFELLQPNDAREEWLVLPSTDNAGAAPRHSVWLEDD